jgi:uncharacterized SAM-binding protein YcdF (DUF218 family)
MFFILSKILAFLLCPAYWIYIGVILYFFTKKPKRKKGILIATLSLTFMLTNNVIYKKTMLWWQTPRQEIKKGSQFQAGILLGGMYTFDDDNQGYFNDACDRFIQTNKLYQSGIIKKIIISGGSAAILTKEPSEADSLKKEFILSGVKEQDIIIDPASRSTYENALFTKQLTDSLHLKPPFALVTSAFHMPRSLKVFRKQHIEVVPVTSDYIVVNKTMSPEQYILPNPKLLNDWGLIIKEWIGIIMYKLTGKA